MNIMQLLSGYKTYITGAIALILLVADYNGWFKVPPQILAACGVMMAIFLRAGVGKGPDDPGDPPAAPATVTPPTPAPPKPPTSGGPLMIAFASLALLLCSCASTPQKIAYRATGTAIVSVDAAMNLWGAYVAANHPPVNQELAVKNAYEKYQAAMVVVSDAGAAYAATSVTNATAAQQAMLALQQATSTASQDLGDLESLLTQLGVKLQ